MEDYAEEEGGNGPGEGMPKNLTPRQDISCTIFGEVEPADAMLICKGCLGGFHMDCLDPPLKAVPQGERRCTACLHWQGQGVALKTSDATKEDITQDTAAFNYLANQQYPEGAANTEKNRIRDRAKRYSLIGNRFISSGNQQVQGPREVPASKDRAEIY